jgi:peptidoglycan/LPS O-acetylase OafA/YrhL
LAVTDALILPSLSHLLVGIQIGLGLLVSQWCLNARRQPRVADGESLDFIQAASWFAALTGRGQLASGGFVKFRHDINALRALAVTAVVLFHYNVSFIPGGYIGVDVFFVISGYLMTAIIMGRLARNRFNIWDFYYDRGKRIVPGLLGMCFVVLAAGYFLLEPVTYHYVGSTAISTLLFFSNFRFWEATGYFDSDSCTKWFLHTWSLSVEWQFYLAYPIILMGLYAVAKTRRFIIPFLWSAAFLSLALCIWSTKFYPASAFYLLPQRAWELLAGGIVALQFRNGERKYASILLASGFLLIGLSIFCFDKYLSWPSFAALLPVIGTCFVIAANRSDAAIFQSPIIQTVGKWSYSIYLWHWPIAVGEVYFYSDKTTPLKVAAEILILATIIGVGGWLFSSAKRIVSARLAESRLRGITLGGAAVAASVAFAIVVTANDGLPSRWPDDQKELAAAYGKAINDWEYPSECDGRDQSGNLRPCRLGAADDRGTIFIGDSFAEQIYSRFADQAKRSPEKSFTFLTTSGCPPVPWVEIIHDRFHCNGFVEKALQFAEAHHFKRLVLVSLWDYFKPENTDICLIEQDQCVVKTDPSSYYKVLDKILSDFGARLIELRKGGTNLVIVSPTPWGDWNVPVELAKRKFLGIDSAEVETIDRDRFEMALPIKSRLISWASSIGASFIDPAEYLCDPHRCRTTDEDGIPLYRDRHHLRAGAVKTSRFQFLDDAAGVSNRLSAVSAVQSQSNTP